MKTPTLLLALFTTALAWVSPPSSRQRTKVAESEKASVLLYSTPAAAAITSSAVVDTATTTAATPRSTLGLLGDIKTHGHCQNVGDRDILVRAARGEQTERTPVWLMRQAGRYMSAFRQYSDHVPFRVRSETPAYAVELSLQCHRAYGMDGIIMFSDILTPLPCLGIDFDVKRGVGPVIDASIATVQDVAALPSHKFDDKVPFVGHTLDQLSQEAKAANTSLIGFVGAPLTLAAYTIEGKSSKQCLRTKQLLMQDEADENKCLSAFLDRLATMIGNYACYQIEHGAQVIQLFESWAHQFSPRQWNSYAKPYVIKVLEIIKAKHENVPVIYFANGGGGYLELQRELIDHGCDMLALDWSVPMAEARARLGPNVPVSGNIDPTILFGSEAQVRQAVRECIDAAGGPGNCHVLNLGHGVMQGTPETAVQWLVDECKSFTR